MVRKLVLSSTLSLVACLGVSTVAPGPARAATAAAQPTFATYAAALRAAQELLDQRKLKEAGAAFEAALGLAKTDDERADALMGVGRTLSGAAARVRFDEARKLPGVSTGKRAEARLAFASSYTLSSERQTARDEYGKLLFETDLPAGVRAATLLARAGTYLNSGFPSGSDLTAALADLESAAKVEGIPDAQKAEALLQLADLFFRLARTDEAQARLTLALALPGVAEEQKAKALLASGNIHLKKKETEKARAAWAQVPLLAGALTETRVLAHRSLAASYLAESKAELAQAELEKAVQLPGLAGGDKVRLLDDLGDLLQSRGSFAAARSAFTRIVELADAGPIQRLDATLKVGMTYAGEKNYGAAREWWEKLAMGASTHAVDALRRIALSHSEEKNYPTARATLDRWIALPLDNYWKEDAWVLLGQIHERESNPDAARSAYQKLLADPKARGTRRVQAALGIIRTHQAVKNQEAVMQSYALLPEALKSTAQASPQEMSELAQLRNALSQQLIRIAAGQGKEKATLPTAITLYGIVERMQARPSEKLNVSMALGELLLEHGMLAEAKAEFQKVTDSRDALPAQKQKASQKLKEIQEKGA